MRPNPWLLFCAFIASHAAAQTVLPRPDAPFAGRLTPDRAQSAADWPKPVQAPPGAPNVVLILLDDGGCGASADRQQHPSWISSRRRG